MPDDSRSQGLIRVEKRMDEAEYRQGLFDKQLSGALQTISEATREISKSTQQLVAGEVRAEERNARAEERHAEIKARMDGIFTELRSQEIRLRGVENSVTALQATAAPEREAIKEDRTQRRDWVKVIVTAILTMALTGLGMALFPTKASETKTATVPQTHDMLFH